MYQGKKVMNLSEKYEFIRGKCVFEVLSCWNRMCLHYRTRPACTSIQSNQNLYCYRPTSSSHLDIPKNDNVHFQK